MGFALALGVGMAALAASIGLAPIVGAFLGGMLLSEVREKYRLEEPIFAIESFLAPIFFAMVGVRLELSALASPVVLVAGTVVTVIAILGKVLGGFLGALTQGVRSALTVGVGMAPRGEVGLIVAALGLKAGAVNEEEYAIVLFMVVFTTLFAPFALKPLIAWTERSAPLRNSLVGGVGGEHLGEVLPGLVPLLEAEEGVETPSRAMPLRV